MVGGVGARRVRIYHRSAGAILSDWRPYDPANPDSQHYYGKAIDVTFVGIDPLLVLQAAEDSGLWEDGGLGIYVNEAGAVSFHFDTRGTKARWGGVISHPIITGSVTKKIEYVDLSVVVDLVKKNTPIISLTGLLLIGWLFVKLLLSKGKSKSNV
jgi:hypothetical protein